MSESVAGCPSGHPVPAGAQFCPQCGGPITPQAQTCPSGHPLAPGQAFCPVCGAATSAAPTTEDAKPNRKPLLIAIAVIGVIVIGAAAFWIFRSMNSAKEVTAGNAASLLRQGGIVCDDVSSLAAGQGSAEAELIPATIIACDVQGPDGTVDRDKSVALIVADSDEDLAKVMRLSGICENEDNLTDVIAVGANWIGTGQGSDPSPDMAQQVRDALGGEITTAGEFKKEVCSS